jgi:EAL domain-containing protein (putative c-di-GMP-specific phosphodiesterase class I)
LAEVKIDGTFVRGLDQGGADAAIVRNLLRLATDLGVETVAAGVETRQAWEMLAAMGCDRAQGYYAQPALAATELERWLAHSWPAVSIAV